MKFKKLESGRSMVEMLGVLAIIGVLSVGGIAGYSLSMRRHRANQIVDIASKYALVAYGLCQQKVLNGEYDNIFTCDQKTSLDFSNAGVGNSPAGLASSMWISEMTTDETTGIDTVQVFISFQDQKLCQAVASISGSPCVTSGTNHSVDLPIKQN